jgi:hypothetical protein
MVAGSIAGSPGGGRLLGLVLDAVLLLLAAILFVSAVKVWQQGRGPPYQDSPGQIAGESLRLDLAPAIALASTLSRPVRPLG